MTTDFSIKSSKLSCVCLIYLAICTFPNESMLSPLQFRQTKTNTNKLKKRLQKIKLKGNETNCRDTFNSWSELSTDLAKT